MGISIKKEFITKRREPFFLIALKYISDNAKVLDVGSGDGLFPETIGKKDVYLFDANKETICGLSKKFPNCYHGELPHLPFPDVFFDVIHSSHVMEHLEPEIFYDTLKEIDRCLKPGGYLIVSGPLLRAQFFDDLSHVKPYNPSVFEKYLSEGRNLSCTRPLISDSYSLVEHAFRYDVVPFEITLINCYSSLATFFVNVMAWIMYKTGFRRIEKTGFTLALKKGVEL